jgi:hypothetical protein
MHCDTAETEENGAEDGKRIRNRRKRDKHQIAPQSALPHTHEPAPTAINTRRRTKAIARVEPVARHAARTIVGIVAFAA